MAESGLELETERLSVVVPPGGTAAEESAKVFWACKGLPNHNKRAATNNNLVYNICIFIEFRGSFEEWLPFTAQG